MEYTITISLEENNHEKFIWSCDLIPLGFNILYNMLQILIPSVICVNDYLKLILKLAVGNCLHGGNKKFILFCWASVRSNFSSFILNFVLYSKSLVKSN